MRSLRTLGWIARASALACTMLGCTGPEAYCGLPQDITMRLTAYCSDIDSDPVCDYEGQEAHYEDTPSGLRLVGGAPATCDMDDAIVCPGGTVGEPRCIRDPEL
ncbi:MAG: hypothetical protein AB7S26_37165 [Sandaracinaceae bacterium]